ncbi:MAG: flippase-like domain-containing protein [Bacteroidales bacterium]|nr:flippase-like domain-containing protein [Bacteroidales bacterium]
MKKKIISTLKISIAFGIGVGIIYLSLKDLSPTAKDDILSSFLLADYSWVALSLFFGILSHLIRAQRWRMLLQPMGYDTTLKNSFLAVMIGYFANLGIPRSGELARCTILYKEDKIPVDKSFGTVIIERTIDMIIFFSLFFLTFLLEFKRINTYVEENIFPALEEKFVFINSGDLFFQKIFGGIFIIILIIYILFWKKIKQLPFVIKTLKLFSGIWEGLKSIVNIKQPFLFIIYSLLIWLNYYLMIHMGLQAISQTSGLGLGATLSVLVLGSIGIMLTPGGIGLYPVIVAQTLVLYGVSADSGYGDAIGWLTWSSQTIMIIILGSVSVLIISLKKDKKNP